MFMLYIWLAVIASGLLLEAVEAGTLVTVWFSAGAVAPFIMSLFGITEAWYLVLQIVIFGLITVLCLIFLRPIAKRTLFKNNQEKTNMDIYVGKKYKITRVDNEISYIKINGVEYRAVDDSAEQLQLGDQVQLVKVRGNKVVVDKINEGDK